MTRDDILTMLLGMDHSWFPAGFDPSDRHTFFNLSALAMLSGFDIESEDDIPDAVRHSLTLISCGVLTTMQVATEAVQVEKELMEWGQTEDLRRRAIVESN